MITAIETKQDYEMTRQLSALSLRIIRLLCAVCCVGIHWRLAAAELWLPSAASTTAGTDEPGFHDPFAAESAPDRTKSKISDPIEPVNRGFFWFNDKLYFWLLKPGSRAYSKVAPKPVRTSVHRFFDNTRFPSRFINNVLQGRLNGAGKETARFVVNTTIGLAGFFDPAGKLKLKPQPADFDQTLGVYGIRPGFYLNLPFLGPSSARGGAGLAGDTLASPWTYVDWEISIPVVSYEYLNKASLHAGEYENFKKAALDPYVALRSAYYDHRQAFIEEGRAAQKAEIFSGGCAKPLQSPKGAEQAGSRGCGCK